MIKIIVILSLTLVFLFTSGMTPRNTVILTAKDVLNARNIEAAIDLATGYGAHPGTVILDAKDGDFVYTQADKSINIYYPNVTLLSKNRAVLANCNDGIYFDNQPTGNTLIQGITFICDSNGVIGWMTEEHAPQRVTIKDNRFYVQSYGIGVAYVKDWNILGNIISTEEITIYVTHSTKVRISQNTLSGSFGVFLEELNGNKGVKNTIRNNVIEASGNVGIQAWWVTDWKITNNIIKADTPIHLIGTSGVKVVNNYLEGLTGIQLGDSYHPDGDDNKIVNNLISATWTGILLGSGADRNKVTGNAIKDVQQSGIALSYDENNFGNKVSGNKVACAPGYACVIIDAPPAAYDNNKIKGNTYWCNPK